MSPRSHPRASSSARASERGAWFARVLRPPRPESERDARPGMEAVERVAWMLDDLFKLPFLRARFGLDALLGLVPWAGDTVTALFALFIVGSAVRYRVPKLVIVRMALNVAIDYLVGLVPVVGDASDFFIKSNRWNLELLRLHAGGERKPSRGDVAFVVLVLGGAVLLMAAVLTAVFLLLRAVAVHMPHQLV